MRAVLDRHGAVDVRRGDVRTVLSGQGDSYKGKTDLRAGGLAMDDGRRRMPLARLETRKRLSEESVGRLLRAHAAVFAGDWVADSPDITRRVARMEAAGIRI